MDFLILSIAGSMTESWSSFSSTASLKSYMYKSSLLTYHGPIGTPVSHNMCRGFISDAQIGSSA